MTSTNRLRSGHRRAAAALLAGLLGITLAACGGGGVAELLSKLITARFVPSQTTVAAGSTRTVELEVTCSFSGMDSPFGRLKLDVSLARGGNLPPGVTSSLVGGEPAHRQEPDYWRFPCIDPHPDPTLRFARIPVQITVAPGTAAQALSLLAYVEIEPERAGEPSKDATTATLGVTVTAAPAANYGANLLVNPSFEQPVLAGGLPTAPGNWQGDAATTVGAEQATEPVQGASMLRFIATGPQASASLLTSQQWQIVDVSAYAADIAAGRVSARASAWFHSIVGTAATDRRFDIRLLAFDGPMADLPQRYAANTPLLLRDAVALTPGGQWLQVEASDLLPVGTTYVLVEIYAYEDIVNDATAPEFDGHYADNVSLVLTRN